MMQLHSRPRPKRSLTHRALGVLRVLGVLVVVQVAALSFVAHNARASAREVLLQLNTWLLSVPNITPNTANELFINGARLALASGSSELAPDALLDRLQGYCENQSALELPEQALEQLAHMNTADSVAPAALPNARGVFRLEQDERGIVACFARSRASGSLFERLRQFATTGELSALGELRYFSVLGHREGRTLFLAAWPLGKVKLLEMFPRQGDAPGKDLPGLPRPAVATRTLSAGTPAGGRLVSYTLDAAPQQALAHFRQQLTVDGFQFQALQGQELALLATRADRAVVVSAAPLRGEGPAGSQLTLAEF
jgi:hypothetical protein